MKPWAHRAALARPLWTTQRKKLNSLNTLITVLYWNQKCVFSGWIKSLPTTCWVSIIKTWLTSSQKYIHITLHSNSSCLFLIRLLTRDREKSANFFCRRVPHLSTSFHTSEREGKIFMQKKKKSTSWKQDPLCPVSLHIQRNKILHAILTWKIQGSEKSCTTWSQYRFYFSQAAVRGKIPAKQHAY